MATFFVIVKGIYTWSAIKAVGTLRRIVPLQLLGRLRESADLNSDDGTALLNGMNGRNLSLSIKCWKKQTNTETNKKQQQKKRDEAESNKPTQLEALWNWGWKRSIQCLKLLGLQ